MQIQSLENTPRVGGGRISSPKLRKLNEQCEDFTGLEEGVRHYDLLMLVKRAGKYAGFSPRMINLLDYYMAFTRDIDWEEGSRPIVYKSISSTARDMGVSERQIQALEKQLFEIGAITWHDSGNHRRYGLRCEDSGQLLYAYGVDLTPLAYLKAELHSKLEEKQLLDKAWQETKRQISFYRRHVRGILLEIELQEGQGGIDDLILKDFTERYNIIAYQIRSSLDIKHLRDLLEKHKDLLALIERTLQEALKDKETDKDSCASDENFTHLESTNQLQIFKKITCRDKPIGFQESVVEPSELSFEDRESGEGSKETEPQTLTQPSEEDLIHQTGLQHVSLKQLLNVASDRFKEHLPLARRAMNHNDFVEAAYQLKNKLYINQGSWARACLTLGRIGAAVCVILTDRAALREENPVRSPGAYFNAMITRAKSGDLKLQKSVMGHLKREFGDESAVNNNTDQSKERA